MAKPIAFFSIFNMHYLLLSLFLLSALIAHSYPANDMQSLLEFKASITQDPQNALGNWNLTSSFCNWTGVKCSSRRQRVVALNLDSKRLNGRLSPFLGNLSFLRILNLRNNSLYGHIPHQFGSLRRLQELNLSNNALEGSIPITLGACRNLVRVALVHNSLSGSIPSELGFLPSLQRLLIGFNHLTGPIPSSLSNISSLIALGFDTNNLTGTIPPQLGLLTKLQLLDLGNNPLTGQIPSSFSNCTLLRYMILSQNHFTGHIPQDLGTKNPNLQRLSLNGNHLNGSIPISLGNCSQLSILELQENQLSGMVPMELGQLHLLECLHLYSNNLVSGSTVTLPIITALTNCSLLQRIDLSFNQLGGILPLSIGKLSSKLSVLDLGNNGIGGQIPEQIGNLTNLPWLVLASNFLNGTIPLALQRLQKLERLNLADNKLEGSIPREIGELKSLGLLRLSYNMLSGQIPSEIGKLQQLRYLYLEHGRLSGEIPVRLGNCLLLELLDLSYNRLSGSIPHEVAGLPNLDLYFNLSSNTLQGPVPLEIGKMDKVQAIDLSMNQLSAHIPATIESCTALQYLNLSHNALQGPIPVSLGNLQNLQDMDLSSNKLSGKIPISLGNLKVLQRVNFSFNYLTGEIPRFWIFEKLNATSFMGNPDLCGPWIHLHACPKQRDDDRHLKRIIAPVAGVSAFILCCLIGGLFWSCWSHRHRADIIKSIPRKLGHPRISYQALIKATDGFSEANLLGVGSCSSVYRGTLSDGTMTAVKVINLQKEAAAKSFTAECRVLGRARHRNLVRIITSCSNHHFKGLVLQFMSKGSLEKCLYPPGTKSDDEIVCGLNLSDRLNIVTDIAYGMEYLHHNCSVQVVHCDLKPSNVLLDDNMIAHVSDFGIAGLICSNSMESLTSTLALKGSIGYIAPEYGLGGRISTKGDVYSYGIVLLEMLTRKRPTDSIFVEGLSLQKWIKVAFPDRILDVIDSNLLKDAGYGGMDQNKINNCINQLICLGLLCTKEFPKERPNMKEVVGILENIRGMFVGGRRDFRLTPSIEDNLLRSLSAWNDAGSFDRESYSTY